MKLLIVHALLAAATVALLVLVWLMTGGEWAGADGVLDAARTAGFWPFWVGAAWAVALVVHAGLLAVVRVWRGQRRRRRRRASDRGSGQPAPAADGSTWIAVMFTDIVGSTALTSEIGDAAYGDLVAAHRRTVRSVTAEHDGSEVGTQGDGCLIRFPGPAEAALAAIALQRRLAGDRERDGDAVPRIRIGVHAGEVAERDGDVLGHMVNVAARVADQADADEILVTEPVVDHSPRDLTVDDRGLRELSGLSTPRHLLALRWREEAPR